MTMLTSLSQISWRTDRPRVCSSAKSFLPMLRAAVASHPNRPDLLRDLVVALRDDRQWEEILDLLLPLAGGDGLTPTLACELARAAIAEERPELALKVLDAAIAAEVPGARRQKVLALYGLNRMDEARAAALQVLDDDPGDRVVLELFANDCLAQHAGDALAGLCRRALKGQIGSSRYLAYLAAAHAVTGRAADVANLIDPEHLCSRIELAAAQVDHEELARVILEHTALAPSPEDKPTHGRNLRLEGFAAIEHPAVGNLLSIVRRQVEAYLADRLSSQHPLIVHRPQTARLEGWGLVLSQDGYEETHIHPQGWLTAIYYARVPQTIEAVAGADPAPPGSLRFGPWPPVIGGAGRYFPIWHEQPKAGTLLIFPSFFGHGTIPTGVDETRVCVALDVVPCAEAPDQ